MGTITLAEKLGSARLSEWISRFGFGHKTGIDFPGETRGIVPPLERWSGSTIGTLPIGHGIAITPVQMAAAYGTVANDGVWLQPHLVDRIGSKGQPPVVARRILTRRVARQVRQMMEDVVIEGTGQEAQLPGYTVAGKTGTAAKPDSERRLLDVQVRRVVRRHCAGDESAPRHPRHGRRAGSGDLGRRRRGSGLPADRRL